MARESQPSILNHQIVDVVLVVNTSEQSSFVAEETKKRRNVKTCAPTNTSCFTEGPE